MSGNMPKCFFKINLYWLIGYMESSIFLTWHFVCAIFQSVRSGSMQMKNICCILWCATCRQSNLYEYISRKKEHFWSSFIYWSSKTPKNERKTNHLRPSNSLKSLICSVKARPVCKERQFFFYFFFFFLNEDGGFRKKKKPKPNPKCHLLHLVAGLKYVFNYICGYSEILAGI